MRHQLSLRGSPQQPFNQFFPNPEPQLKAHCAQAESHVFQKGCAKPATSSKLLRKEPQKRGRARPWPGGPERAQRAGRVGLQSGGGWTEGGKSTYQHPDRRDWWQREASPLRAEVPQALPLDTTGVRVRPRKAGSSGKNGDRHGLHRVRDTSSSHRPPCNRGSGGGSDGGSGGNSESAEEAPACRQSGI